MLPEAAIGRVTIRAGARGDAAALRAAVARQLASADLSAGAGAPAAVLLVRRLADPRPRGISASPSALAADRRWEAAAREALERHRRAAARPDRGRVDPSADAVLFTDEAELLACVARSMVLGGGPIPWWHAAAARHLPARSVPALLGGDPRLLPPAFARLQSWGVAEELVRAVPPAEALRLVEAVAAALALPAALRGPSAAPPRGAWPTPPPARAPERTALAASAAPPRGRSGAGAPGPPPLVVTPTAPWHPWYAPPAGARLEPAQEALLGVALVAQRAPAVARTPRFAEEAAAWARSASPAAVGPAPAPPSPAAPPASRPPAPPVWPDAGRARVAAVAEAASGSTDPAVSAAVPGGGVPPRGGAGSAAGEDPSGDLASSATGAAGPGPATAAPPRAGRRPAASSACPAPDLDPLAALGDGVETALGGVLYLLDAMEALDLPACFEAPCGLASEVGAAGTLEALARAVLAGGDPRPGDPIWAVLAALDGRPAGRPPRGAGLRVAGLALPPAWLAPLGGAPAAAALGPDPALAAALEVEGWPAPLARWTGFVAPFLRHRLARALGLASSEAGTLADALLALPAHVHLTPTHLDLVAGLDAVRLPVRMAGLDRSPGWLPGLGRVVLFHFR